MTTDSCARCLIIGEGTLPVQCANILLKQGYRVLAVSSPDQPSRDWAVKNGAVHIGDLGGFIDFARSGEFEYLFSIVNYRILPASLLAMPTRYAINYHDALLPKFAGTYATSWAIMQGQHTHGITWHVMSEGVDEGDILRQVEVPVSPTDTAHSLNLKCYYTAIRAFDELANELRSGKEKRIRQDLTQRTYFEFTKRPPAACLINFAAPASEIDAFVRALDFDQYPNPLGLPKIKLRRQFYAVARLRISQLRSDAEPGTITALADDSIAVSTQTEDVVIPCIESLYGTELSLKSLIEEHGLAVGAALQQLDPETADRITRINTATCRHERFWARRLGSLHLPGIVRAKANDSPASRKTISGRITHSERADLDRQGESASMAETLLIAHALFLAGELESELFDVGFHCDDINCEIEGIERLFAPCIPLRIDLRATKDRKAAFASLLRELRQTKASGPYLLDLAARHPRLGIQDPLNPQNGLESRYPIVLGIVNWNTSVKRYGTQCTFDISADGGEYRWTYNSSQIDEARAAELKRHFDRFLCSLERVLDAKLAENAAEGTVPLLS